MGEGGTSTRSEVKERIALFVWATMGRVGGSHSAASETPSMDLRQNNMHTLFSIEWVPLDTLELGLGLGRTELTCDQDKNYWLLTRQLSHNRMFLLIH